MRLFALAAFSAGMFLTTIPTDANAVVCAKGVVRAGWRRAPRRGRGQTSGLPYRMGERRARDSLQVDVARRSPTRYTGSTKLSTTFF
jgi:hypothetical protein